MQFELTGAFTAGEANATFSEMDDTAIGSGVLKDPKQIAALLGSGDGGYAMSQDGSYYFVQAKCPEEEYV